MSAFSLSFLLTVSFWCIWASSPMDRFDQQAFDSMVEYYNKDPNTPIEKMLLNGLHHHWTVDFVVDINFCPSSDDTDRRLASSPVTSIFLGLDSVMSASEAYYNAIGMFIDWVTLEMRPSQTYTAIIDNGQKYYIRGRPVNQTTQLTDIVTLADPNTRARTLWPHMTGIDPQPWHFSGLFKNNLGFLTKLALCARDNGLPIVLKDRKEGTAAFTIVITDGSAKTPAYLYSSDPSKTMIIDIGGRRYAQKLAFSDIIQYANVITLDAPQVLPLMANTARYLACSVISL